MIDGAVSAPWLLQATGRNSSRRRLQPCPSRQAIQRVGWEADLLASDSVRVNVSDDVDRNG